MKISTSRDVVRVTIELSLGEAELMTAIFNTFTGKTLSKVTEDIDEFSYDEVDDFADKLWRNLTNKLGEQ